MGEGSHIYGTRRNVIEKHDINGGHSRQLDAALASYESKNRHRKTEHAAVFDKNGKLLATSLKSRSKKSSTGFRTSELMRAKNGVLTHNHPKADKGLSDNLAGRIGVPFSGTDLQTAITCDMAEVRATTPTYTYSLKRPKNGWGVNGTQAAFEWSAIFQSEGMAYAKAVGNLVRTQKDVDEKNMRHNVVNQHKAIKRLAKRYGWKYSRKKVGK